LSPVRFVGAIGADCPFDLKRVFKKRQVDLTGLEIRNQSKTFRWQGSYQGAMNEANTDKLELNVLAEKPPKLPELFTDSKFVFLANTNPSLQLGLLKQLKKPKFVVADTMNCWINNSLKELKKLIKKIDALILNDGEAKLLTNEHNMVIAGRKILQMGVKTVIIKKGEHGSMAFNGKKIFALPSFPTAKVIDPTGAGDSFAGGMMGYLAKQNKIGFETISTAMAYGTVIASFTIEDFSLNKIGKITTKQIESRLKEFRNIVRF
jgi:bifunctional ADP-heptose synthase (sugar kinase/adenylyltransferase)